MCDPEVHFVSIATVAELVIHVVGFGDIDEEVVRLEVETPAKMVESSGKWLCHARYSLH